MVKVTVILGSSRPGGFDMSLRGLANQTYDDFEILCVDERYHKRHSMLLDYVKKFNIKQPFYHVPNHRSNFGWSVHSAGANTGLMLADGELVIFHQDYAYAPPDFIENHVKRHIGKRMYILGPHYPPILNQSKIITKDNIEATPFSIVYHKTTLDDLQNQYNSFNELCIFEKEFVPPDVSDYEIDYAYRERVDIANIVNIKNDSMRRDDALNVNGLTENFDNMSGPSDTDFGVRMQASGCEIHVELAAPLYHIDVRPYLPKSLMIMPAPFFDPRGTCKVCDYFYDNLFLPWPNYTSQYQNPYKLWERRKEIWEWRELSKEREPVIPRNDVSNNDYFLSST